MEAQQLGVELGIGAKVRGVDRLGEFDGVLRAGVDIANVDLRQAAVALFGD